MSVQKIVSNKGNESSLKITKPSSWALRKKEAEGINKGRLDITKGKMERVGMTTDLSANEDQWEWGISVDMDLVVNVGLERSDEESGVIVKLIESGNEMEEVGVDKFFLGHPDLLTSFVDYGILVGMFVDDAGAERGSEEAREVFEIYANGFFWEISKSGTRSRRARRRHPMNRCEDDWQG